MYMSDSVYKRTLLDIISKMSELEKLGLKNTRLYEELNNMLECYRKEYEAMFCEEELLLNKYSKSKKDLDKKMEDIDNEYQFYIDGI